MKHITKFNSVEDALACPGLSTPQVVLVNGGGLVQASKANYGDSIIIKSQNNKLIPESVQPGPIIEMVDLGLPSGTLWAATNVGANPGSTKESYYGDYYAWGEVETKSNYTWSTYKYCTPNYDPEEGQGSLTKYTGSDSKTVLDAVDDIVTATYGSSYVMPTVDDIQELIDGTDSEWVTDYNGISGLNGRKFMKKSDHTVFIFIPAAGSFYGMSVYDAGNDGSVWSSSLDSDHLECARHFSFTFIGANTNVFLRHFGVSVRAIQRV